MIQTQSQNEEIEQITEVWNKVWFKVGDKVRWKVRDKVRDKLSDGLRKEVWFKYRNDVWRKVFK